MQTPGQHHDDRHKYKQRADQNRSKTPWSAPPTHAALALDAALSTHKRTQDGKVTVGFDRCDIVPGGAQIADQGPHMAPAKRRRNQPCPTQRDKDESN